jgi:hypothetical protein
MQEISGSIPLVSTNHFHTNSRSSVVAQIAPTIPLLAGLVPPDCGLCGDIVGCI